MSNDLLTDLDRPKKRVNTTAFAFDLLRAIMYLSVSGFLFYRKEITVEDSRSFVIIFASVVGIYGLFRLFRALVHINIIKF